MSTTWNTSVPDEWIEDDLDELAHRDLNRRLERTALARKYPTCPCSDPACAGGTR